MSNIREVAKRAGVSTATVSRYYSEPGKLSKKSSARVADAIAELQYKPNLLARNFSQSRSYAILVLVPDIANPFFARVIRGIEDVGQQKGYSVLLGNTRYCGEREKSYVTLADTRQADGIIQLNYNLPLNFDDNNQANVPFVQACECIESEYFPTVQVDNINASKTIVEHLTSLGHKHIACVQGPEGSPLTRDRREGYHQALESAGIQRNPALEVFGDFSMASGHAAATALLALEERPTAAFCMNDEMAIGLIQAVKASGLKVPDDISVTGFDDIEYAKYCDPPLTTVAQPAEELGRTAVNCLFSLMEKSQPAQQKNVLATEIVLRQSTAVAPTR